MVPLGPCVIRRNRSNRSKYPYKEITYFLQKTMSLPKELLDEIAVQSLKQDAEEVFTKKKWGESFDKLMVALKYNENNRMWCIRHFTFLHLPFLIKKAFLSDLNKWWFVDSVEGRRIKYQEPMTTIICNMPSTNNLKDSSWFDKVLDEWVMEQPKEENALLRVQSKQFLTTLEEFCFYRPEYINWLNLYSFWVSNQIAIPLLSIDSFKMWLDEECRGREISFAMELRIPGESDVCVQSRYARAVEQQFAFVHNNPSIPSSRTLPDPPDWYLAAYGYSDNIFEYCRQYEYLKKKYAVQWGMMDIFWGEDQKLSEEERMFERSPWILDHMGEGDEEFFEPEEFYANDPYDDRFTLFE